MCVNISLLLLINKLFQPLQNSKCFEKDRPCESKYFERYLSEMQFNPSECYNLKNFRGSMPPNPPRWRRTIAASIFSAGPILESFLRLCTVPIRSVVPMIRSCSTKRLVCKINFKELLPANLRCSCAD